MDTSFIEDLPKGPLDHYRSQANFDWKKLKLVFEEPDFLKVKLNVWKTLEKDPLFQRPAITPTADEQKRLTALQFHQYCKYNFLPPDAQNLPYKRKTKYMMTVNEAIAVCFPDVSVKYAIGVSLFTNTLQTLGTERHQHMFQAAWNRQILSCLALTEVAHGSNTKQVRTTATYDKNTQEFVIHTPDFEAAKCWVGNLGKTCTVALLFAQLYTDGQCHGLHAFVVPIRNPKTLLPYPGIVVGDMGEKVGLNGIDNGTADVTPEGDYESSFSEPGKILGAALENLSTGRMGICQESVNNLICAVTISIRYAAVRRQFSDNGNGNGNGNGSDNHELPIIEYQLHQWRLFPYVASAAVFKMFITCLTDDYLTAVEKTTTSTSARLNGLIGDLRNINDPCVTYEGDNNVLIQQTSNWLLRQWLTLKQEGKVNSPLNTCTFLKDYRVILNRKFSANVAVNVDYILSLYEWLITYLICETDKKQQKLLDGGESKFAARNNFQVYRAGPLSRIYGEYLALRHYWKRIHDTNIDPNLMSVLENLASMYGLSSLDKHLIYFYEGNFASGPDLIACVKEGILKLCCALKPHIVSIVDALAPPDFVVNSVLGKADGKVNICNNTVSGMFKYKSAVLFSFTNIYKPNSFKIPVECHGQAGGTRLSSRMLQILSVNLNYNISKIIIYV
ncbi:electron transport oxidoreductase [Holotrichia oblita]|uniref:Electron transport oxidoreductase n=1 Tax=Holotrichia oblita TaxID=644536 RepID=A0ACB9T284_HOLOL|nr:electron transport oxidoreductase [Holotrichia oblita]